MMIAQWISLFIGILMIVLNLHQYICVQKRFWVMVFWLVFWGSYVLFYVIILFTDLPAHDLSSAVRVFRNTLLAVWFILNKYGKQSWK